MNTSLNNNTAKENKHLLKMSTENITRAWKVLKEKGYSDLIDKKQKNNVVKDLKEGVPGITQEEIQHILEVCLW